MTKQDETIEFIKLEKEEKNKEIIKDQIIGAVFIDNPYHEAIESKLIDVAQD